MNELTIDASKLPGFLRLADDKLLLSLCVRQENLADPKKWCEELRRHYLASLIPNLTVADVERLQEWSGRLAMEAAGDIRQRTYN